MRVSVKNLLGQLSVADVPENGTVADLARQLAGGRRGACRLFFKGVELQPPSRPLQEALAGMDLGSTGSGSHVVLIPLGDSRGHSHPPELLQKNPVPVYPDSRPVPQQPAEQVDFITIDSDEDEQQQQQQQQQQQAKPGGAAEAVHEAAVRSEPLATPCSSAGPASPAPGGRRGPHQPASPLDTLLPGFASLPNPSPVSRHRRGGQQGRGQNRVGEGLRLLIGDRSWQEVAPGPGDGTPEAPGGRTAAEDEDEIRERRVRAGCGFFPEDYGVDEDRGSRAVVGAAAGKLGMGLGVAPSRSQRRTLLQQHLLVQSERLRAEKAELEGAEQQAAQQQDVFGHQQPHEKQAREQHGCNMRGARSGASTAASSMLWEELVDELKVSEQPCRSAPADPVPSEPHGGARVDWPPRQEPQAQPPAQHQEQRLLSPTDQNQPPARHRAATRGMTSIAEGDPERQEDGAAASTPQLALRLHRGELSVVEARALDALPLPPCLQRLMRIFEALASWQGFLTRQHMPATWANSRAHVQGLLPLDDTSPLDVLLAAELAPHCIALLEVAQPLRTALDSVHPVTPLAAAPGAGEPGASAVAGASAAAPRAGASLVTARQGPMETEERGASGGRAAALAHDMSLRDDLLMMFEITDHETRGRAARSTKGKPAATDQPSQRRRRHSATWATMDGEDQEPGEPSSGLGRPVTDMLNGGEEHLPGQQQQQQPEGDGSHIVDVDGAAKAATQLGRGREPADSALGARRPAPAGPPGTSGPHLGKRALARRTKAFRRSLAFAVLLIHRRFMAHLSAGAAAADVPWRVMPGGGLGTEKEGDSGPATEAAAVGAASTVEPAAASAASKVQEKQRCQPELGHAPPPPAPPACCKPSEDARARYGGGRRGRTAVDTSAATRHRGCDPGAGAPIERSRPPSSRAAAARVRQRVQQQLGQSSETEVGSDGAEDQQQKQQKQQQQQRQRRRRPEEGKALESEVPISKRQRWASSPGQPQGPMEFQRAAGRGEDTGAPQGRGRIDGVAMVRGQGSSRGRNGRGGKARKVGAGGDADDGTWDPVSWGSWHPLFDPARITLGELRAAAEEHRRWLSAQLRLAGLGGPEEQGGGPAAGQPAAPPRAVKRHARCTDTRALDPRSFLDHLKTLPWYDCQVACQRDVPARRARTAAPLARLSPQVLAALASRGVRPDAAEATASLGEGSGGVGCGGVGVESHGGGSGTGGASGSSSGGSSLGGLYTHQAAAIDALLLRRRHTVVCTSTASGKSVCYNVPVLEALARDPDACALYLFPTKALAQDQLSALRGMLSAAFGPQAASIVETYDGDTPHDVRSEVRARAQLLITNPDMLHQSILPYHTSFARLLGKLRYVIVDEGHAYHGAFGCHTALVLRRLRRVCSRAHGSSPLFVVTSATMSNPRHHACLLLGVGEGDVEVVAEDGSPHGPKAFVLWNPPLTDEAKAAQAAGEEAITRTEGRAAGKPTYRARRQQMRLELREANAARRRGVSVVRGMSEAEWQAAVRLASGKRVLSQCLFEFRYGGDRPASLDLLTETTGGAATGTTSTQQQQQQQQQHQEELQKQKQAQQRPRASPPPPNRQQNREVVEQHPGGRCGPGPRLGPLAGPCSAAALDGTQTLGGSSGGGSSGGSGGGEHIADADPPEGVVRDLLDLLKTLGVDIKDEQEDEGRGEDQAEQQRQLQQQQQQQGQQQQAETYCMPSAPTVRAPPPAAPQPPPLSPATAVRYIQQRRSAVTPQPPRLAVLPASDSAAPRSAADQARRAALVAQAEAALSAVQDIQAAPAARPAFGRRSKRQAQQQQRKRQLAALQISAPASVAPGHPAGGGDVAPHQAAPDSQPPSGEEPPGEVLPVGGSLSRSVVPAEVQAEIQRALPPRGSVFERHGAAGTSLDQRRESPIVETSLILAEAVQHGLRTIAFCKTRKLSEMVAKYTRDTLKLTAPALAGAVRVYRGGYSPAERRSVEAGLHGGTLLAVAATNALELGIDVGALDLTLHLGFPGSVASLWQQAGRAGRREQRSLSVCVAFDGPLDQHFMRHPGELFGRPIEGVQLDPGNKRLLRQHAACAAAELPLLPDEDGPLFGAEQLRKAASDLTAAGLLSRHARAVPGQGDSGAPVSTHGLAASLHYCGPGHSPAPLISLRTIDPERFIVVDTTSGTVLEEIEANKAFYVVYDGAVYLHQGEPYVCSSLDLRQRVAYVYPSPSVKHYTSVQDVTDVHVTGSRVAYPTPREALAAIESRRGGGGGGGGGRATAAREGADPKSESGCQHQERRQHPGQQQQQHGCCSSQNGTTGHKEEPPQVQDEQGVKQEEEQQQQQQQQQHNGPGHSHRVSSTGCQCSEGSSGSGDFEDPVPSSSATCESCYVTVRFLGYHRVAHGTGRIIDSVQLFLPDSQWETQASYIRLPASARAACRAASLDYRESVHAAAHALLNVLPLYMVCNSTDVATECDNPYDTRYRPERLLLYDKHPGGIGLAAQATPLFPELLRCALELVTDCPCTYQRGCPACVQHLDCKNYNAVLNKQGAVIVLRAAIEQQQQHAARVKS